MDVLNLDDTKAGALFLLRQLVKGDNTSIELRNSMIRADVDDSYFKFIIEGLSEACYIEESFSMWRITPKGVRYLQEYERRLNVGSDWSIEGISSAQEKQEAEKINDRRWNRKMTVIAIVIGLLSLIVACISPLVERGWQAILSLFLGE
jgi:hypothetical protein